MIRESGRDDGPEGQRGSLARFVRRHDRERYLTALFAPADRREAVLALFSFNYEIARTREVVSEPLLGRIRLQWWREGIEEAFGAGTVRAHEVLTPLSAAIRRYRLDRDALDRMIDARERDLEAEPPATMAALDAYCDATSGAMQCLVLDVLGEHGESARHAARAAGTAYAASGLIRAIPFHARGKRQFIPSELAESERLDPRDLFELRPSAVLAKIAERMAARAEEHLLEARAQRREIPKSALPALLPARLAEGHLGRLRRARFDVFAPAVAQPNGWAALSLAIAMLTGRY